MEDEVSKIGDAETHSCRSIERVEGAEPVPTARSNRPLDLGAGNVPTPASSE